VPPGDSAAIAVLDSSPRHGEWVRISSGAGDSLRAWVVYPERSDDAPVVVVIHEIFGLTPWVRSVADHLAADGFIAVAPDLLTSKSLPGSIAAGPSAQDAVAAVRTLDPGTVQSALDATARFAMQLPAATPKYAVMGFCWGGTAAFAHAMRATDLDAAVVYYGSTPEGGDFSSVEAPVLGLYGARDNRVNATIPATDSAMRAGGGRFQYHVLAGAGHGFLRAQSDTANRAAAEQAWPLTIEFLRTHLGG
jgi:carboxymethylenebutenolidase